MKYRIVIEPGVERIIEQQARYIAEDASLRAAGRWLEALYDKILALSQHPKRYPIERAASIYFNQTIRRMVFKKTWLIYFTIQNKTVHILHAQHGHQQRPGEDK